MFEQLTDEGLREAEQSLAARKRELEHQKWDAELVGKYFRVIRRPESAQHPHVWLDELPKLGEDDYVTLERTLGVGAVDKFGHPRDYVYADVVYIHIQRRDDSQLVCSGFEVSHATRREPYLKIQPTFYSCADFRHYLGQWSRHTGPVKHFDEISAEEYQTSLSKAIANFTTPDAGESGSKEQG